MPLWKLEPTGSDDRSIQARYKRFSPVQFSSHPVVPIARDVTYPKPRRRGGGESSTGKQTKRAPPGSRHRACLSVPGGETMRQGQPPFSRHAGFFAALQRVEDRLASEQRQEENSPPPAASVTTRQSEPEPFSDTMTASPLLFLDPAPSSAADRGSSGPALDFLTEQDQQPVQQDDEDQDHDGGGEEEDIARLMALLGLSPPPTPTPNDDDGCDCSGADGFMAKIVGVVGPKCDGEKRRLGAWIRHYHRGEGEMGGGGCREPARLAHLLIARASCDTDAVAFPATVKEFLGRDPPQQLADDESG
ncbi:hypothetical protein U9M48_032943 [Paspalum notatum var. saurae]|uniref:Uncharacterized protein n=1 Tax=Paspalum notatum var. saurae TaxID=547442 RepID=A0AAQ3U6V5_PASNO